MHVTDESLSPIFKSVSSEGSRPTWKLGDLTMQVIMSARVSSTEGDKYPFYGSTVIALLYTHEEIASRHSASRMPCVLSMMTSSVFPFSGVRTFASSLVELWLVAADCEVLFQYKLRRLAMQRRPGRRYVLSPKPRGGRSRKWIRLLSLGQQKSV